MKRLMTGIAIGAGMLLVSGCGLLSGGVYDMPLPGGADLGSDPITITADFEDVLDLVPQSSVKVDNVSVGRVSRISLNDDGQSAHVELKVNGAVSLPEGTTARLRQTSLLGEKYVALIRPAVAGGPELSDGTNLGLAETSQAAEVEQVLGALSLLLNGGGIAQFQEISKELQQISDGRPDEIKGFLREMETFMTGLESRKEAITAAIDGLANLSETLEGDKDKITTALQELSPGMRVIVDQRTQLTAMLASLDELSTVTVATLNNAQDDMVADLEALAPILEQLAKAGSDLPHALEILLTYPFPDSVLGAIKGDYLNVFITTNFRSLPSDCDAIGCAWPQPTSGSPATASGSSTMSGVVPPPSLLPPTSSPAPGLVEPTISVPSPSASPTPSPGPSDLPSTEPSPTGPSPSDPSPSDPGPSPSESTEPDPDDPSPSPTAGDSATAPNGRDE